MPIVAHEHDLVRAVRVAGWRLDPARLGRKNGSVTPVGQVGVCPSCQQRNLWIFSQDDDDAPLWACLAGCAKPAVLDALGLKDPTLRAQLLVVPTANGTPLKMLRALYGDRFVAGREG